MQALVFGAAGPHYVIEALGFTDPNGTVHVLSVAAYTVPLLYAALHFGWEGAVMTALWSSALTMPSALIWHLADFEWLAELVQLVITLPVGLLVAWRVDLEKQQRLRAERTSSSLRFLNDVSAGLAHTFDVEREIPRLLRELIGALSAEAAWVYLTPRTEGDPPTIVWATAAGAAAPANDLIEALNQRLAMGEGLVTLDDAAVAVALVGDGGMVGSLGASTRAGMDPDPEQQSLLVTLANQLRVALENAQLYRERQESLRSYAHQAIRAMEDERLRIARELHDDTAQELVYVVRRLETLAADADPVLTGALEHLVDRTRHIVQSVRRFSWDLRPSVLDDLGLVAAIDMVVEGTTGLPRGARLQVVGDARRLEGQVELSLFRIVQEAFRNIEKHAQAQSASVQIAFSEDTVSVSISDDGLGFPPPKQIAALARTGRLGIVGMEERAKLVGGQMELHSVPGQGTRITVEVPVAPPPAG